MIDTAIKSPKKPYSPAMRRVGYLGWIVGLPVILFVAWSFLSERPGSIKPSASTAVPKASRSEVLADVEKLIAVGTDAATMKADREMIDAFGMATINSDPQLQAVFNRVMEANGKATIGERAQGYTERVESFWLPMVHGVSTTPPATIPQVWDAVSKFEQATQGLKDGDEFKDVPAAVAARKKLKAALIARQVAAYPALRKGFAKATYTLMWEHNVEVKSQGTGSRQIAWIGGLFASNANVQSAEQAVETNLVKLHFVRSSYRWIPDADGWSYKLVSPEDNSVGLWKGDRFEKID